jgi:hypothetical protein
MDGTSLLETLRADHDTALSRLGSSKALYALTAGEMDAATVRAAAADDVAAARDVFAAWAEDADDAVVADRFGALADEATDRYDRVAPADHAPSAPRPLYETLAGFEATPARAGGLLARAVVSSAYAGQLVGFFVGDADPTAADLFRDVKDDLAAQRETAVTLLDDACYDEADWTAAQDAADAVVTAAYDDYVDTLESMGVKPKNVC